jgi:RNA recognition motif-containing protein
MDLFSSCGGVVDARIKRSETKGKTLMYGFVRMDSLKGALTAAKELNGFIFMGRAMK